MRYEIIAPFVASTRKVLEQVMQTEITGGEIALMRGDDLGSDLSILIAVRGESEGCIIVCLDRATAAQLCRVMNGDDCKAASPLETDTIAELSNMIAGNATSSLNDLGFDFAVFPPAIVSQAEILLRTSGIEIFRVPLGTPYGTIDVNVALRTN